MYDFIIKIFKFVALLAILSFLVIYLSILAKPEYFLGSPPLDYFYCTFQYNQISNSKDYKNIIIGDSRGNASVNPKKLGDDWINLSIPGSDFFEGYISLKRYLSRNKIDTLIMIYGITYIGENSPFFNLRTIPFKFPTYEELTDLEKTERKYKYLFHGAETKNESSLLVSQFERRLEYLHFPPYYRSAYINGLNSLIFSKSDIDIKKNKIESQLKENLGYMSFGEDSSNDINGINGNDEFVPKPINLYYLDLIMKIAGEKGIYTILIIPPMNESSFKSYKNSKYEYSVNRFFGNLESSQKGLTLIKQPVSLPDTMFGDPYHLNKRGAEFYTRGLKQVLAKMH